MQGQLNFVAVCLVSEQTDKKAADGQLLFGEDHVRQS